MQKIDWYTFRKKNENYRQSFEELCYFLFCRKFRITEGIRTDYNQVGLETCPIYNEAIKGDIGFQSKFFDNKLSDSSSKKQIIHSIENAKNRYDNLKKIIIYTHLSFGKENPKYKLEIENKAGEIEIEWHTASYFDSVLSQPQHLDLAQLYFGFGDEIGFIKNSCNPEILTLLQSSEYLELPLKSQDKANIKDINIGILSNNQKEYLIAGHPGSGKSILIYKLLQEFGGLNKETQAEMQDIIETNNAVPMLINLKDCVFDTLENIIRNRQKDYKLREQGLAFIYLFDGLDELNEKNADSALTYIRKLKENNKTKKIIISCRSGNINKQISKIHLPSIIEYHIDNLEDEDIDKYFQAKKNQSKIKQLESLKQKNKELLSNINDILLIKLLWDTVEAIDSHSTIINLLSCKIDLLLKEPVHKKNIEELNLLNPKEEKIISLNQEIAFKFQKKFQFRFPQDELQNLILKKFPRLDYRAVNTILNYLLDLFFDNPTNLANKKQTYIYQHRRYQEFFFAQKLKFEYEKNRKILRNLNVLSNSDFFQSLFLPYLRSEYEKENNLPGLIELNLIDVYLGKHKGCGADDAYYMNSKEFIPSLACQYKDMFEELIVDNNLQIKEKIFIDIEEVIKQFDIWIKDKSNYWTSDYLKNIWENGIASLLENIALFNKAGKQDLAKELLSNLDGINLLFEKNKFLEDAKNNEYIKDPFWERWEDYIYINIVVKKNEIEDVLNERIRENCSDASSERRWSFKESEKEKLIKAFFRVCLAEKPKKLFGLVNDFDEYEFFALLGVLSEMSFIPIFIREEALHSETKLFLQNYSQELTDANFFILFYKRFFGIPLSQTETDFAKEQLKTIINERGWEWHRSYHKYALVSYSLAERSFGELFNTYSSRYYREVVIYAALFNDFIGMLQNKETVETVVRNYISCVSTHEAFKSYLKKELSFLWTHIFIHSNFDYKKLSVLRKRLITEEHNLSLFSFYIGLKGLDIALFSKLANEYELNGFEKELKNWEGDIPSYVDRCFELTFLFSGINKEKTKLYFSKGINEGILRHGWRKDIIVSYNLIDALEILWKNNWESKEILIGYTREVFDLALRVRDITDGKGTWQGPYNVLGLLAFYDIKLAEEFKKELIEKIGYYKVQNSAITSVLLGKVNLGLPIEEIEEDMTEYRKDIDRYRKPRPDYFEQIFKVYLAIAQCNLYTEEEKNKAFSEAYNQVDEANKLDIDYFLPDTGFKKEKLDFIELCEKYNREPSIYIDKKDDEYKIKNEYSKASENDFIQSVNQANTTEIIIELYGKLNHLELKKSESWETLIDKTFEVSSNIKLFTALLKKNSYPHTNWLMCNSPHFHFGLAAALDNINTKEEIEKYLFQNSGHEGFKNIMKAFELNNDKKMCIALFKRYLRFCDFLVN